ncbi:MAG: ABC transporter permease [Lachnospiraceae bacterium]|nr:ABC transporter permease [Lachnospiraceae bacterium]
MRISSIAKYCLKRFAMAIVVLFIVTIVVFAAIRLAPGDPVLSKIGPYGDQSQENYDRIAASLGLDKPVPAQYFIWIGDCLRGDFGVSLRNSADVAGLISQKITVSLELILVALSWAVLLSIPIGIGAAIKKGSVLDQILTVLSSSALAMPSFCFGLVLIVIFSVRLGILPPNGYISFADNPRENIRLLLMPALTLGLFEMAVFTRFIRSETIEILNSNYIRTAKAKGLPKGKIYFKHALKNTLVTFITVVGSELGTLLGGTIIIEQLFGWSGLGWFIYQSVINRDYPVVQAGVLFVAVSFVIINMTVDIIYTLIDPRIELN